MAYEQQGISKLVDEERYIAIVNSSGWPPTRVIAPNNKVEFLEGLINQEVLKKREAQIAAFGKGLEQLGLLILLRKHSESLRPVFVHTSSKESLITAKCFLGLM